jgi:hypothetical protein
MSAELDLDDVADGHPIAEGELKELRAVNARLSAEVEKLNGDIRCMVEKAADQKLDGYRELGARAAAAKNAADDLRIKCDRMRAVVEAAEACAPKEHEDDICAECGEMFTVDDGLDPSDFCDLCAQSIVTEIASAVRAAREKGAIQ